MSKNIELIFYIVLYMSFISTFVAIAIILIRRIIGSRLPAIFSYILWSLLLFRLLVPISFVSESSIFNYLPVKSKSEIIYNYDNESYESKSISIEESYKEESRGLNVSITSSIWITVSILLVSGFTISYLYSMYKFREGIIYKSIEMGEIIMSLTRRNIKIYSIEWIDTPVVIGIFKPRIIVPSYTTKEENKEILKNIVIHEVVHIKRKDNIIKLLSIFTACVHWFNPIVWKCLFLSHVDMEKACDERVINITGGKNKKQYAQSLLSFAIDKRKLGNATTVAFGESNIKVRIKGVLEYKKPKLIVKIIAGGIFISSMLVVSTDASTNIINIDLDTLKDKRKELWIEIDNMSPYVVQAVIASQDQNFDYHNGIDLIAIVRASINTLVLKNKMQGASTITQQLIKNVCDFNEINLLDKKRSQIYSAIKLEQKFKKEEILEAYLNSLYFGRNIRGIEAAAQFYFNKNSIDLSKYEAAKLIAIIDNPKEYDIITKKENNEHRAKQIIKKIESF